MAIFIPSYCNLLSVITKTLKLIGRKKIKIKNTLNVMWDLGLASRTEKGH